MDKKRYLKRGYRINLEIESKKEVLEELKANLDGIKAIQLTEKFQGGDTSSDNAMFNRINKLMEVEKDLASLYDIQVELNEKVNKVENFNERMVLRYRYILNYTWEQISEKMGYSTRQVIRIHGEALKNFEICH